MTYHSFPTSSSWFHEDAWLDFHMWGSYHEKPDNDRAYKAAGHDWNLPNPKPTLNGEPAYEEHPINWLPERGWFDAYDVRQSAYWSVFAGAFGHTYGCYPIWQFYTKSRKPASPTKSEWQQVLDVPGSYQLQHLKNLMLSRPFVERVPDQTLLSEADGNLDLFRPATRGSAYAFYYITQGGSVTAVLNKISGKKIKAWWYNPRDGSVTQIGKFPNRGTRTFTSPGQPGRGYDWVLVLDDAGQRFPRPGVPLP
jgi:hypothetical protein